MLGINATGALEHLNDGLIPAHFQNLTSSNRTIKQLQLDDFGVFGVLKYFNENIYLI